MSEGPPREWVKRPQLAQDVGVALVGDSHVVLDRCNVSGGDVFEVAFDKLTDIVLEGRAVQLVELREKAFLRVARSASGRIELCDALENGKYFCLAFASDHHEVRDGAGEESVVVELPD